MNWVWKCPFSTFVVAVWSYQIYSSHSPHMFRLHCMPPFLPTPISPLVSTSLLPPSLSTPSTPLLLSISLLLLSLPPYHLLSLCPTYTLPSLTNKIWTLPISVFFLLAPSVIVEDDGEDDVAERRSRILKKAAEKQLELVGNP